MLNHDQLRDLVIKPTLDKLHMNTDFAVNLLLFTCAVESDGGTYLKQIKGPALGIYQMEPATYNDIWQNYIKHHPHLSLILGTNFNAYRMPAEDRLIYDLEFATVMARLHYRRVSAPFPKNNDAEGYWEYYKAHFNTVAGKAKKEASLARYKKFLA